MRWSEPSGYRSKGLGIILYFSFLFLFNSISSNPRVLPVEASHTIVQSLIVRRCADNHKLGGSPTRGAPQTTTSSCHSFAQSAHLSVFRLNRTGKPATVFCTHVLRFGRSLPDCPSRAGERLECSFSPWNFDPFSFLMLRCMGLGYCPSIVALAHHLFDLAVILGQ